jgi:hypothetical protein
LGVLSIAIAILADIDKASMAVNAITQLASMVYML